MTESEREMLREQDDLTRPREFTSLQRTYEDSVPPTAEDWDVEHD